MFNALFFLDMQPTNQCVLQILCDRNWVQRHIPQKTPTCACRGQHLSLNMDADRKGTTKHSSMLSSYSFFAMLVTISNMNRVLNLSTSPANSENRKKLGSDCFLQWARCRCNHTAPCKGTTEQRIETTLREQGGNRL